MKKIRRFIIFRPGSLGDTLVMVPILRAIKRRYPQAVIEYLAEKSNDSKNVTVKDVAELIPEIDKVILYKKDTPLFEQLFFLKNEIKFCSQDRLLYLCNERGGILHILRDLIFFIMAGVRSVTGMTEMSWHIIKRSLQSEYERIWNLVASLDLKDSHEAAYDNIRSDKKWAENFVSKHNLQGHFLVMVCPGSKMQSKRWPIDFFAQALKEIGKSCNDVAFIIIGDSRDQPLVDSLMAGAPSLQIVSAIGCDLMQTSGLIQMAELYIGNDTGPMHMAALHGKPCIALFSSRDQEGRWYPLGSENIVFRGNIECEGCMRLECFADPPPCLVQITPEQVSHACIQLIKKKGLK